MTRGIQWFAAAGFALVLAQVVLIRATIGLDNDTGASFRWIWPLILGLAIPTGLAFVLAPRIARLSPTRAALGILVVAGLAMRLVWFGQTPPIETDFERYMWDGGVVAKGMNPYRFPPELFGGSKTVAKAPQAYRDLAATTPPGLFKRINFPDIRTIYPSTGQLSFALGYLLAPFKVDGLRAVFLAAEMATLGLLVLLLRALNRSPLWAALYWWNPLTAYMAIAIAHVDALVPPCVLAALLFAYRERTYLAMAMLGVGAGVKIWPVVLAPIIVAPLVWRRENRDWQTAILACAVLGAVLMVAVGPVIWSALRPGSGLTAYSQGWSMNNAPFAWGAWTIFKLSGSWETAQIILRPVVAAGTAGVALAAAVMGDRSLPSLANRMLLVAATVFYLSPAQFPWYALWFLPLAALVQNWPLLFASVVLPAYFLFFPLWAMPGGGDKFFFGAAFIHSVPVLGWLAWTWQRNRHGRRDI